MVTHLDVHLSACAPKDCEVANMPATTHPHVLQEELGETCATVMVSWEKNDQGGNVHFEVFQCSEQCVR